MYKISERLRKLIEEKQLHDEVRQVNKDDTGQEGKGEASSSDGYQMSDRLKQLIEQGKETKKEQTPTVGYQMSDRLKGLTGNIDQDYVDRYLTDTNAFLSRSVDNINSMGYSEAMSGKLRESYQKERDDLLARGKYIRTYLQDNQGKLDEATVGQLMDYLDKVDDSYRSVNEAYSGRRSFYSQWETEDDYNSAVEAQKEYERLINFDTEAAAKELDELAAVEKQMRSLNNQISQAKSMPSYSPGSTMVAGNLSYYESELTKLEKQYGSYGDLKTQISQKNAYLTQAERAQNAQKLAGVTENSDFGQMSRFLGDKRVSTYEYLVQKSNELYAEYIRTDDPAVLAELEKVNKQLASHDVDAYDEAEAVYVAINTPRENWENVEDDSLSRNSYSRAMYAVDNLAAITDKEIAVFNYWYNKSGGDKAMEYLDSLQEALNYRAAEKRFEAYEDKWALEMLFGIEAGLDQFGSGIKNLFTGGDDYIAPSSTQILSGMVRKDLGDNGPKLPEWLGGSSLGQGSYDIVTTLANIAPSYLVSAALGMVNPTLGKVAGDALMGASAAGNAYAEKINLGYSKDEARSYGLMVGASEATLQYLLGGIGKLGGNGLSKVAINNLDKVDNVLARVAKSAGGKVFLNGVSEGFEEGLQAILEPYLWQAVSGEEGSVNWEETLYNSLLGFVTGGVFESPGAIVQSAGQNIGYYKTGADIRNAGGTDALMALANEVAGVAPANMQNAIQKQSGKVDKKATSRRVGKLYDTVQSAISQADISQSLQTKGFSKETANDIAAAVIASNNGRDLSSSQRKLLKLVEKNSVAREVIASAMSSPQSSVGQKMRAFQSGVARGNVTEAASAQLGRAGNVAEGNLTTAAETAAESRYEVAEDGKTIDGDGNVISITGISSIDKGRMVLQTEDGKTVDAGEVSYGSQDEALVYEAVANLESIIDGETATKLAKHLLKLGNVSSKVYVNGIVQAYTYGYYGYGREAMNGKNTLSATLSEEQRNVAYGLAEQYRATKTDADQKAASGKKRIAGEVAGKKRSVAPDGTEYKKVRFEGEIKKWSEKQKAEVEFIDFIAANFSGNTVRVYESYKNAKGQYVYKDSNGKIHAAPNGMYIDSTGDIYLDLNSGNHGEGLVMNTFAHELYHHIERESPQKARKLAEFLVQELGYENVEIAVQRQIDKAKRAGHGVEYLMKENGISRTAAERLLYDRAFSDFVADSLETIFTKGNVVEALQKLKSQDAGLFNMIKSFIDKWVKRIRQFYRSHSTISIEGDMVSHLKKFEQIQQMFAEALVDAGENFQAAEVQKNTTVEGDIKYSLKGTNRDGIEVYETSEFVKSLSWKERKKLFLNLMRNQYRGRTAKFIRNGHAYYATLEYRDVSKNIYGDTASDPKGRDAKINVGADGNIFELVEHAEYFLSEEEHGKTQRMHRGVKYWDYFIKTVQIDGEVFDVLAHIRKKETGNFVYDIEMYQNKKIEPSSPEDSLESGRNGMPNSSELIIGEKGEIVNSKPAEAMDIAMDANTESVAPAPMYSERTWTESDYVQEREKAAEEIAKAIGVSKKKAKAYIDSVNGIAKMIAEDRVRLDYFSSPNRSSFIGNVEYGGSFDFSTLCKKRRLLTGTFTAIQKALPNTALTADEILDIRNRMKEAGLEVSCGLCYVEGSRANMGQFAKEFLKLYKQYYPDAWQPNMADVNTPDGIEWVRINHPECYEQYEYFWNHYGTLKPGDKNLFASQQKPKLYQLHTEYKGEILQKFKNDDNVEEKNLNGGIRLQSFSDFEIVHLIDTMQIIMDMSRVGLAGQAYTKVPDFAWALGDTGLKINLSLIAKGVDGNGKLIFDDVEGMPIQEAVALRNRYSQNVGTILVAFNDEQLLAAMADERVDYIIPFHRSQWKKSQYSAMGLPAKTKDYTFMQNEKFIKPQYHEYRDRMVRDKATNYMPNEYWDFSKSGKENAEAYLEMCARNNKRPKFYKLLQNNGDGSYSLKADGSTDGYWKLLIDFKMYDNEGNGSPQLPVKPEFNMDEATRMLNDYRGGHSNFPVAQGIVDDFVAEYKESHKGAKFSDRDSEGKGLTEDQLEFFENSKARDENGNLYVLYHGSRSPVFTEFDMYEGVWLTPDPDYADKYADGTGDEATELEASVYYDPNSRMYKMYANITNPLDLGEINDEFDRGHLRRLAKLLGVPASKIQSIAYYEGEQTVSFVYEVTRDHEFIEIAKEQGFDGFKATEKGRETWCAFSAPNQVKLTTNEVPSSFNDIRYSDRDYLNAVNHGDMETAQKMVDEAAKKAGFSTEHLYHGTSFFGFTSIDTAESDDSISFFVTNNSEVAQGYMPWYEDDASYRYHEELRRIGKDIKKRSISNGSSVEKVIEVLNQTFNNQYQNARRATDKETLDSFKLYHIPEMVDAAEKLIKRNVPEKIKSLCRLVVEADRKDMFSAWADVSKRYKEFESAEIPYDPDDWSKDVLWSRVVVDLQSISKMARTDPIWNNGAVIMKSTLVDMYNTYLGGESIGMYDFYGKNENQMVIWGSGSNWKSIPLGEHDAEYRKWLSDVKGNTIPKGREARGSTRDISEFAKHMGYRSVVFVDIYDAGTYGERGVLSDVYSFFYPQEDIKSADPVTYDDSGNVIPLSERFNQANYDIRYSDRDTESVSNRSLLANAFEGTAKTDMEKQKIQEYRGKIDLMNGQEQKLRMLNQQIKELYFAKGKRDKAKIRELRDEATKTANRISIYDKQLLRLESSKPLQDVLEREKKKAYQRAEKKGKEALAEYRKKSEEKQRKIVKRYAIEKQAKLLMNMLAHPTKDAHVPSDLQKPLEDFLHSIDFSSKQLNRGGEATIRDIAYTRALTAVRAAIAGQRNAIEGVTDGVFKLDIPDSFLEEIDKHNQAIIDATNGLDLTTNRVYDMSSDELADLGHILTVINKAIRDIDKLHMEGAKARVSDLAMDTQKEMRQRERVKGEKGNAAMWASYTPWHAFRRMGSAAQQIFHGLMQGQAKLARTADSVIKFSKKTFTEKEVKSWEKDVHTINLQSGESVKMSTAQIMGFYCLSKREQGDSHMMGGGIRIGAIKPGKSKDIVQKDHYVLSIQDIAAINSKLTDRQRQVAEDLQKYMETTGGRLINEISMARWGYAAASEIGYYPIKTDDATRDAKDPGQDKTNLWALLNKSFTKSLAPGAKNAMLIDSIFDVFADHMSQVAEYNAFALPLVDAMKWFNYRERINMDDGHIKDVGVQRAIRDTLGTSAVKYFTDLMTDINSSQKAGRHENFAGKLLSRAKVSSVGFNLRVAIQQPTAILRASLILDAPELVKGAVRIGTRKLVKEMQQYSGIALWKSMGYYDLNISRGLQEQIKGDDSFLDKANEVGMWLPGKMDEWTWARIWAACKAKASKDTKLTGEALSVETAKLFEDVVYQTQVADSVLTRSSLMRSKSQFMKEATSFMAEPTVSLNILLSAFQDYQKGHTTWQKAKRGLMIGFCGYALPAVTNAIFTAFADAWRDDDEYEDFLDKFNQALFGEKKFLDGNLFSELNPLEKIPFIRDAISMLKGYSVAPGYADMIQSGIDLVDAYKKFLSGKGSKTEYGILYQTLQVLGSAVGIGAAPALREVASIWNHTVGAMYPEYKLKRWETNPKTEIRDAYNRGYFTSEEAMAELLIAGVASDENEAFWLVREWDYAKENGSAEGYSKYGEYYAAVAGNDRATANMLYDRLIAEKVAEGYLRSEAKDSIASSFTTQVKNEYMDGEISRSKAIDLLTANTDNGEAEAKKWDFELEHGFSWSTRVKGYRLGKISESELISAVMDIEGESREEAEEYIRFLDLEMANQDISITASEASSYFEHAEPAGIAIDVYLDYKNKAKDITGEGKKKRRMDVIHSLPLTNAQKDALYYAEGWAASTIHEAPWH